MGDGPTRVYLVASADPYRARAICRRATARWAVPHEVCTNATDTLVEADGEQYTRSQTALRENVEAG